MGSDNSGYDNGLRTRLWVAGEVNEDWTYTAMIQNTQDFTNNAGDEDTKLNRAYLDGRIGGLTVRAGRWDECTSTANILDVYADGVKVSYGDKVKVYGMALKGAGDDNATADSGDRIYVAGVEGQIGAVNAYANYFNVDNSPKTFDAKGVADSWYNQTKEIYNVGVNFDVAKDLNLAYEYMWGNKKIYDTSKDGYVATLAYKGADAATPGTWGLSATYFDQPMNAVISPTTDAKQFRDQGGYKGYGLVANYTLAKNIVAEVSYYDTEAKIGNSDDQLIYADLYFTF